jgi:hypothetical protein
VPIIVKEPETTPKPIPIQVRRFIEQEKKYTPAPSPAPSPKITTKPVTKPNTDPIPYIVAGAVAISGVALKLAGKIGSPTMGVLPIVKKPGSVFRFQK